MVVKKNPHTIERSQIPMVSSNRTTGILLKNIFHNQTIENVIVSIFLKKPLHLIKNDLYLI